MGAATRAEISAWFDKGVERKATHLAVFCDTFDHEDYPVYITTGDTGEARRAVEEHSKNKMVKLVEVYHLGSDKETQMAERRAHHYEPFFVQGARASNVPVAPADLLALMKEAWPEGRVTQQGVSTLGGWTCLGVFQGAAGRYGTWRRPTTQGGCQTIHCYLPGTHVKVTDPEGLPLGVLMEEVWTGWPASELDAWLDQHGIVPHGLLPVVDPNDRATWGALLFDLALAIWGERARRALSFALHRWDSDGGVWAIFAVMPSDTMEGMAYTFGTDVIDTADPRYALVCARIQVRNNPELPMPPPPRGPSVSWSVPVDPSIPADDLGVPLSENFTPGEIEYIEGNTAPWVMGHCRSCQGQHPSHRDGCEEAS